jgi:Cu+-exporting ATPase
MSAPTLFPPKKPPVGALTCFHCHDPVKDEPLWLDDKSFCCEGCKMVYEILNANDLCQYYQLDAKPGLSLKTRRDARAFAYLDDPAVQERLLEFSDAQTGRITFYVPQMHCVSCIWLLEHLYRLDDGVTQSRVNFLKHEVTIVFDKEKTSLRQLAALLASIGYAPEINLGDVENDKPKAVDKSLLYKMGLAGFAFGNIMLLSFPEYLGMEREHEPWFFAWFGYLNLLLGLPVLLFSARDYLVSAWNALRTRHLNIDVPLAIGMVVLFGRSAYEIVTGTGAGYMDSFAGLLFFLLTGRFAQQKTWHQLSFERDYKSYFPVAASVRNGDTETSTPVQRLEPGDIIVVRSQELIPADGILLKGQARIDYSFVTGEAQPVAVASGERVFAGGKQTGESIEVSLTRKVSQSYLTRLWNDEAFKANTKGDVTLLAERAGRYFTTLILTVASAAFAYWAFWRGDMSTAVNAFTAVMIIACPCAVAIAIPYTLGNVVRLLGRNRFYLKNIHVVEALSIVDTVILDKTGTITNVAEQQQRYHGEPLSYADRIAVRSLTRHSTHPLSRRLYESLADVPAAAPENFVERPGLGISGVVDGRAVQVGSAEFVGAPLQSGVFVAIDGAVRGYFEVRSRYRDGLGQVLEFFRQAGRRVWLLSGDQDREAESLAPYFPDRSTMLFNRTPQDKLDFVRARQENGEKVMMLGDGLNDAGALQQSTVGVVVAENTNNFTPACDAIVHADEFDRLPLFMRLARGGVQTVNDAYKVAFCYNVVGLSYAVSGQLSPVVAAILMPLSSITIILFGMGMTNWRAYRLGLKNSFSDL